MQINLVNNIVKLFVYLINIILKMLIMTFLKHDYKYYWLGNFNLNYTLKMAKI